MELGNSIVYYGNPKTHTHGICRMLDIEVREKREREALQRVGED